MRLRQLKISSHNSRYCTQICSFSKANVVLLILLRNCEKRSFVSLRVGEHGAIFFKPRAETPGDVLFSRASNRDNFYVF